MLTRINRVTIHGFKSFAHKTKIPFENSFNCILGPNGSGKSNIGDALCFVLGRISAKSMRVEKSANLIFNGGKRGKPAATGTVEIAFSNEGREFPVDEKEIVVSRTISKKGGSVYRVNGKKKTRTEVLDLLGLARINPNGYNIILQGDITRFVTMSPLERRRILEEISDVAIYEEKKHKANLELNKVDDKLNNAQIILKERKTYLRELKKDRDQALKFKEIKDKIDSSKATYLHLQMEDLSLEKKKYDEQVSVYQLKVDDCETTRVQVMEKLEQMQGQVRDINKEIEQKGEKEQVRVHKEIEELKIDVVRKKTRASTLSEEIGKITLRKGQFREELKDLEKRCGNLGKKEKELGALIARKKSEITDIETKLASFRQKHKIENSQEMQAEIEELDKGIEAKQEEIGRIRSEQQNLLREKDKLEYQLQTLDERIAKVKSVKGEHKGQIATLQKIKTEFTQATLRLNKCLDSDAGFASQLANARRNLVDAQEKAAKLNAKAMSIKATIAGNRAVQAIIDNTRKFKGVYGTVSQLGQVTRQYAQALEVAAGGRMQSIVVDTDKTAAECIAYLKSNKLGSASFIPLNKIKFMSIRSEQKALVKKSGVHGFALDLISFDARYANAFKYVFGATLIVDDMQIARKVGIGTAKMATLDGNLAEASGVMRGGFMARRRGGGFSEKDSQQALSRADAQVSELEGVIHNVEIKREGNNKEITSLRSMKGELEGEIIKMEKTLHLETGDLDANESLKKEMKEQVRELDQKLRSIQSSISIINRDLAGLKSKKQMLRGQVSALRNPRLLAQLQAFEESKQKAHEDIVRSTSDLKNSQSQIDSLIAPEREKIQEIIKQHDKEQEGFLLEIDKLKGELKTQEVELKVKEKASREFYAKYKQLFTEREKVSNNIQQARQRLEKLREKSHSAEQQVNLVNLKNAEIKARYAGLEEEFTRYQGVELQKGRSVEELKKEVSKFEIMLEQMSAVNMKALEIYEKVETEYAKLVEKRESLLSEKTEVLTLMNEIETKKREHFMKTFKSANEHFEKIFTQLFRKGKAHLELENPKSPFEGGLTIRVRVSSKRYMDIKSLSGGEKTMTALSFIFAIQEYQPASFYILDEIDAALDKHNAETLAKLIRVYSDRAQYVVISHNDALISEADTLFGVSMTDGVSKVTSLKI